MLGLLAIAWLSSLIAGSYGQATFCDKDKSGPNRCVVTNFNCGSADFIFKSLPAENVDYEFLFDGVVVDCSFKNFRLGLDTKGSKMTRFNVRLKDSTIIGKSISIDTGRPESEGLVRLDNSLITTSMNQEQGLGFNEVLSSVYFAGSCLASNEKDGNTEVLNMSSIKSYGSEVIPPDVSLLDGDLLTSTEYFGSGGSSKLGNQTYGGGRIYIRALLIQLDPTSKVTANAFNTNDETSVSLAGTGGVIMIAVKDIEYTGSGFSNPYEAKFQALGGYLFKNSSTYAIGSGGRVFFEIMGDRSADEILGLAAVSLEVLPCESTNCMGPSGTVFFKRGDFRLLSVTSTGNSANTNSFSCFTLVNVTKNADQSKAMTFTVGGPVNVLVASSKDSWDPKEYRCILYFQEISFKILSRVVALPDCGLKEPSVLNSDPYLTEWRVNDIVNMTGGQLRVGSSLKIESNSFVQGSYHSIGFAAINYLYHSSINTVLYLKAKTMAFDGTSSIVLAVDVNKKVVSPLLIIEPSSTFRLDSGYKVASIDRVVLNVSSIPEVMLAKVKFEGSAFYCSPSQGFQHRADQLLVSYFNQDSFWQSANIEDNPNAFNSSFIAIGQSLVLDSCTASGFGYIGLGATHSVNVSTSSVMNVSASGCVARDLAISEIGSKYLKICKVLGGSNAGRGMLGSQKSFDSCKYVMSARRSKSLLYIPTSGEGGQKNHQIDTDKSGVGGGILAVYASEMVLDGQMLANGGDKSERDYTMIAGGAGGTISLMGASFRLNGVFSAKGGLSDFEVN